MVACVPDCLEGPEGAWTSEAEVQCEAARAGDPGVCMAGAPGVAAWLTGPGEDRQGRAGSALKVGWAEDSGAQWLGLVPTLWPCRSPGGRDSAVTPMWPEVGLRGE